MGFIEEFFFSNNNANLAILTNFIFFENATYSFKMYVKKGTWINIYVLK